MSNPETVSFVVDMRNGYRASQFYTRKGDAIRKAKQMNSWYKEELAYKAVTGVVTIIEDLNENKNP